MENSKKLYLCPNCRIFLSGTDKEAEAGCPDCKSALHHVDIEYNQYADWSESAKKSFKDNYLNTYDKPKDSKPFSQPKVHYAAREDAESKQTSSHTSTESTTQHYYDTIESDSSGWIKGLKFVSWIIFITFIIAGVFAMALVSAATTSFLGFVCFSFFFCAGFMSVAMTMVFLGMAQDVRTIRSRMRK